MRHSTVTVEERVDPEKPMVAVGDRDDGIKSGEPRGVVGLGEALKEPRDSRSR
jgi:hypothetical protein